MKLTPREKDKLLVSVAAMVARGRLARGLAIGGSAHALGTATAAGSDEPSIAPAAALCFMISGALMNLMACSPAAVNALVLLL